MKHSIFYKGFIVFMVIFASCDKFLTTPPLDMISEDQWWKNKTQVEMMVNNTYTYLFDDNEIVYSDCASDNATHREGDIRMVANGTFDSQNAHVKRFWKYDKIAQLNYVLRGIEKAKEYITDEEYKLYGAQIRFIRAMLYYDLVFYFGDVPLVTGVLSVEESRELTRTPRAEVLSFVLDELENKVIPGLQNGKIAPGYINIHAAEALLTRIYLFEKQYDKAVHYADEIIGSHKYSLYNNYEMMFRPQSDGANPEIIFERQYSYPLLVNEINRNLSANSSVYGGWKHVIPLQALVDEYECLNGHNIKDCEALHCEYAPLRVDANPSDPKREWGEFKYRDPRLKASIVYPNWKWISGGEVKSVYGVDDPSSSDYVVKNSYVTGYLCAKWLDLDGTNPQRTQGNKSLTIFRLGDVMLMKAEALIEQNKDLDVAVRLINDIRGRVSVNMPPINLAGQDVLREKLRHERRIETVFEGLRYYDIIRWRIAGQVKKGNVYGARLRAINPDGTNKFVEERFWNDKMYLFPIPQGAIDRNSKLLPTNSGW
jgi:hypothetical protein